MSIEINTGAKSVNWETLLSSLGNVEKTDSVEGKTNFTITTTDGGETRTTVVSIPDDLEIPESVDAGTLQGLVDKLGSSGLGFTDQQIAQMKDGIAKIFAESANAADNVRANSSGSVMFDIYALMALLIDVAQSERTASREMRTAQNLSVQKSYQDQADIQRNAANTGMIVGIVCGSVSAVASLTIMGAQGISAKTQNNIMAQSGADASKMHSAMLQNTDTKANAQTQLQNTMDKVGNEVATRVSQDFEAQLVDDQVGNLRGNLNEALVNHEAAKTDMVRKEENLTTQKDLLSQRQAAQRIAQREYDSKATTVSEKQAAYDQLVQNNAGEDQVNAAKAELDSAKAAQETARVQLDTANRAVDQQTQNVTTAQNDLGLANEKVRTTDTALSKAKSDYQKTVSDVAAQYHEKYQTAVDRLANPPEGTTKAQLQTEVDKARADMEMAYATEAKLLSEDGVMTPSEQKDIVAAARSNVDVTMDRVYKRADFKEAERRITNLTGINNILQAAGGVAQSAIQNWYAMKSSDATRQQAETTKQEEMLDQTKDLFSQAQSVIDQVIKLFQAVVQTENQSMRDAIQA